MLTSTLYKSRQHQLSLFPACYVFTSRSLVMALTVEILHLRALRLYLHSLQWKTASQLTIKSSQSHIATDGQSVSHGVEHYLGLMTRYVLLLDSYGLDFCGAPSLTNGRFCLLYMLLALASAVFIGSKSLGTRDHILLSHI
jgi:hypothetical protein